MVQRVYCLAESVCLRSGRAGRASSKGAPVKRIDHWIAGGEVATTSGRSGVVFDPATGEQAAEVGFASLDEIDRAVAVAAEAHRSWRDCS